MMKIWEAKISRRDWQMKPNHRLCEKHFKKEDIIEGEELLLNGKMQFVPHEKKKLKKDAVPVYFSHKEPPKPPRKPPAQRKPLAPKNTNVPDQHPLESTPDGPTEEDAVQLHTPSKRRKVDSVKETGLPPTTSDQMPPSSPSQPPQDDTSEHSFDDGSLVSLPTEKKNGSWIRKIIKGDVTFIHIDYRSVQIDRYVKILKSSNQAVVYLNGSPVSELQCEGVNSQKISDLLQTVQDLYICPGTGMADVKSGNCKAFIGGSGKNRPPRCHPCSLKRKAVQTNNKRRSTAKTLKKTKVKAQRRLLYSQKKTIRTLMERVEDVQEKYDTLKQDKIDSALVGLPPKQKTAVEACIAAAKAKCPKGRRYTKEWLYECILMRMRGPSLYEKIRRENILPLPSPRTLQRYIQKMKPAYGFQRGTFDLLTTKLAEMPEDARHGVLLIDEMKLSEGIRFDKTSLKVEGFVDLGDHTTPEDHDKTADHAVVMLYQPFKGGWFQSIGAFLSKGAITGKAQAKLSLDAISRLEQCGCMVDAIVGDGAPWNRKMWEEFGLKKKAPEKELDEDEINSEHMEDGELEEELTLGSVTGEPKSFLNSTASVEHPCDSRRRLWFVSDFPHLIKTSKTRVLKNEVLKTPDGEVKLGHWGKLYEVDSVKAIRLAPKLSSNHFQKEGFLTMSVKLACSFFSEEVALAMEHYSKMGVKGLENCAATVMFIRRMNRLIDAMNANSPSKSLRAESSRENLEDEEAVVCPECNSVHSEYGNQSKKTSRQYVEEFLQFLEEWENSGVKREYRFTAQTAQGLRITLTTALEITDYLSSKGYEYVMTRRLNQDALEHFFGRVRQACGANSHPDPTQFIQIFRLLSVASLIRPPRGSNITGAEMLHSLLNVEDIFNEEVWLRRAEMERVLDEALDSGEIVDSIDTALGDHTYHNEQRLDESALRVFSGYVARKTRKFSLAKSCKECFDSVCAPESQAYRDTDAIIHLKSKGHLLTPSDDLYQLIKDLEIAILQTLRVEKLSKNVLFEVLEHVKTRTLIEVGCPEHKRQLTKYIMSFYLNTRMIFACEEYNREKSEAAAKKRKAKHLLKQQRLTS